jgi:cell wall assembly regulator SMI1
VRRSAQPLGVIEIPVASIERQFQRTKRMLMGTPFEGAFQRPGTLQQLAQLESETKIEVRGGLRDLWLLANGAQYRLYGTPAFCALTSGVIPCGFFSMQEALENWRDRVAEADFEDVEEESPRDRRIGPGWVNQRWLQFADFDGGSTKLYYDADPSAKGTYGQIIAYQHDPESVHYLGRTFERFYWKSNLLLMWLPQMRAWRRGDAA